MMGTISVRRIWRPARAWSLDMQVKALVQARTGQNRISFTACTPDGA